jgi:gluconolactonase
VTPKKELIAYHWDCAEAAAVSDKSDAVGLVNVAVVDSSPQVINPNGRQSALF